MTDKTIAIDMRNRNRTGMPLAAPAALLMLLWVSCARPVADFAVSGNTRAPASLQFSNQSRDAESYLWDFGDGNTSTQENPLHRYRNSGNYTVRLQARKGNKTAVEETQIVVESPERCLVEITTPHGTMLAELYDQTPLHRDNFSKLVENGFYDSLLFHRVIDGFMIQGGDPDSRDAPAGKQLGAGGPGYTLEAEFDHRLAHVKGALAAARRGGPVNPQKRSSGSQFYIVQGQKISADQLDQLEYNKSIRYPEDVREQYREMGGTPFLDMEYTVFGRVVEGLDVIDRIAKVPTDARDRPVEDVWMTIRLIK
jgi:peptidyl-prolyl cis-trans isomerase B (cyclophilin B)